MSGYFDGLYMGHHASASASAAAATADQPKSKPALSGTMVTTDGTRVVTPNLKIGRSFSDIDDYSQPLVKGEKGVDESGRLTFTAAKADGFFNKVKNFFYSLVVDHVFGLKDIWSGIVSLCSSTPEQKAAKEKAAKLAEEQLVKKNEINEKKKSLKELNQVRKDYYDVVIFQSEHPTEDPTGTEERRHELAKKYIDQVIEHYGLDEAYDSAGKKADDQDKVIRQVIRHVIHQELEIIFTYGSTSIRRTPAYKEFFKLKSRLIKRLIKKSDTRTKILVRQAAKSLVANSSDAAEKLEAARKEVSSHAIVNRKEALQNLEDLQRKEIAAAIYSAQNLGTSAASASQEDLNAVHARMQELSKQISTNEFHDGDLDALTLDFNTLSQKKLELEKAIAKMKDSTRKEVAKANTLPAMGCESAESSEQIRERGRARVRKLEESIERGAEAFELIDGCIKEREVDKEVINAKLQVLNLKIKAKKEELSNEASNTLATLRSLFPVKPSMLNPLNWFRA